MLGFVETWMLLGGWSVVLWIFERLLADHLRRYRISQYEDWNCHPKIPWQLRGYPWSGY